MGKAATGIAIAAFLGLTACGDDATLPEPVPGELAVSLFSPNGVEGAAVFETADTGIVAVTAEGAQAFHFRSVHVSRIVLLLDEAGEIRFTMSVEDLNQPPQLQIVEVADPGNVLRSTLSGYSVIAEPPTGEVE